jgi:hypothetical protein
MLPLFVFLWELPLALPFELLLEDPMVPFVCTVGVLNEVIGTGDGIEGPA